MKSPIHELFALKLLTLYSQDSECMWRAGLFASRTCMNAIQQQCFMPVAMSYMGMNEVEILEKIKNTELRETCR